jgi:putative Mg2+ transporter-C (MgtC) family protein
MSDWEAFGLIALAGLLGALLGFEREIKEKAAGVRTHLLVSSAAAAIVVLGRILNEQAVDDGQSAGDPTRALHAVVTGIGFLCAGAIITRGSDQAPQGLTTAASLFFAATVGIAVGVEEFGIAIGMTALALLALAGLPLLTRTLTRLTAGRTARADK